MRPSLIKKIYNHLELAANPDTSTWKSEPRIKPSDLGHKSLRRIFYSYMRVPPDEKIEASFKAILDTGDAIHDMVKGWIAATGLSIPYRDPQTGLPPINKFTGKPDTEFPVRLDELDIKKGKVDQILIIEGKLWIGEIKSMKNDKFVNLIAPQGDHIIQTNTYVHLFEYCLQRGDFAHIAELAGFTSVEGACYLYVNKDTSQLKEFFLPKTVVGLEAIVAKIAEIKKFAEGKKLPSCSCQPKHWCPWNKKCARNFNPLV